MEADRPVEFPRDLARLLATNRSPCYLIMGVVSQASPLLVKWTGNSTGVAAKRLSSYTPVLSDAVWGLTQGSVSIVLGKVV